MGFITRLRPNSPVPEIATTLSHATTQARTLLAAVLQATKQPGMPMVTLVTTSHEESWRMPAPRQIHDALLMLLLTPHEGLHPRLEAALLAIVVENLQDLSRTAKQRPGVIEAMKAMTAALSTGCTLEEAYGSVPAAQRDALWQGGPYSGGDPASDLLLNYLALFQGKVIEMALNSRQYACTDHPQLPEGFDQKQASLEDRLRQVETPALTSEYLIQYRQLNQSLYRQEWFVQLPVSVAQQMSNWLLRYSLPSTAVARQLINYCQGQVSAQALGEQWQTIWSQLQQASTLREFLEGVNKALEQGVLTPVTVLYGLSNLSSTVVPLIPVTLMVAAMVGWGQEKFAGWLRDYVGSPSSEATRTLQELGRLAGNCASLKQYAQPALSSLNEWVSPASVPLGITQVVDNPGAQAPSNAAKHLLEQGGAQRWGHDLPPGVTEPPATSNGARPTGIMQAVQYVAQRVVRGTISLLWETSSSDVCEKTDVETPLCPAHGAVYQPTTAPMAAAVQQSSAWPTVMGLTVTSVFGVVGLRALSKSMPDVPDLIQPASEPAALEAKATPSTLRAEQPPPHSRTLKGMLENEIHLTDDDKVISCWNALKAIHEAADPSVLPDLIKAVLVKDFGPSLPRLVAADADSGKFEALDQPAPVRHRRAAETDPQAAEVALVEDIITLLEKASSAAQQQQDQDQQAFGRKLVSNLVEGHFLKNASADEREMWLTTSQTLAASKERLAALRYGSRQQLETNRPLLKQALAEVYEDQLRLDVVENKLKGHLSGDSDIPGLKVMTAALNGDLQVEVGSLELSIGEGADAIRLALPQLVVFTLRDANGAEAAVVLYRTENQLMEVFRSQQEMRQQEMRQYPDYRRMRQSLQAEVLPPATPGPAASRPASQAAPHPAPKPLPQLVVEAALPSERSRVLQFLVARGQRSDGWKPENLPVHNYPGDNLKEKFQHHAELELGREDAQLQRLDKNPGLARLNAEAAGSEKRKAAYTEEYFPTLYSHARRTHTELLTNFVRKQGGLASNATVDPDDVRITFNNQTWTWTDLILGGFRKIADDPFAPSNNFIADALIEHENPFVAGLLNRPDVKEGIQMLMRSSYPGQEYVKDMEPSLDPNDPRGKKLAELNTDVTQKQLKATVEQGRVDGTIDPHTAGEFNILADGLPTVTDTGTASVQTLQIGGRRIPGMVVVSKRQRATGQRTAEALRSDYVLFQSPLRWELMPLSLYLQLIRTSGVYSEDLLRRTKMIDKPIIDAFLRGQRDTGVATAPISNLTQLLGAQWLQDGIDNINEATTSHNEVMVEQLVKGLRGAATAVCIVAAVPCAVVTAGLLVHDTSNVLQDLKREKAEVMDSALMILDVVDVLMGLKVFTSGARAATMSDIIFGWSGHAPNNPTQMREAAQTIARKLRTDFTDSGRINDGLARRDITREQLTPLPRPPGKADEGIFYELDGKHYIQDRYQDQVQVYEVYSDNAWATVRVRDPQRPNGYGAPVHYRDGHWRVDAGGLLGGGGGSSKQGPDPELKEYMDMFKFDFRNEKEVEDYHALLSAYKSRKAPDSWIIKQHLINDEDGWRACGRLGWEPYDMPEIDLGQSSIDTLLNHFDFSTAPPGHAYKEWALYYRFKPQIWPIKPIGERGNWPIWLLMYAKKDTLLSFYTPAQVLSLDKKTFPRKEIADAYARQLENLDRTSLTNLLYNRVHGLDTPDLMTQFPEHARLPAKIKALVDSHEFRDENAVTAYLGNFDFADTDNDEILKRALLSDRQDFGRTPAWVADRLESESWKRYKRSKGKTALNNQKKLDMVLLEEGCFTTPFAAATYTSSFKTTDGNSFNLNKREELVLNKILEPHHPPKWAFSDALPAARMIIFKSQDIPANLQHFEVNLGGIGCEKNLVLPENMPNLKTVKITGETDPDLYQVTLPSQMAKVQSVQVHRVQLQQTLQLDNLPAMRELLIDGCSGTQAIELAAMPNLEQLIITNNPQLRQFRMPDALPKLKVLILMRNEALPIQEVALPHALPALRNLHLEHSHLNTVSFLQHVQMPGVVSLQLNGNHLQDLVGLPPLPAVASVGARNNWFRTIPDYIRGLSRHTRVDMARNHYLNPGNQRDFETLMHTPDYNGPHVQFGIPDIDLSAGNAPPLSETAAVWFPVDQQAMVIRQFSPFDVEDNSQLFSQFLRKLYRSPSEIDALKIEVPRWLDKLSSDPELRAETYIAAVDATTTCDDRVSLAYNYMKEIELRYDLTKGRIPPSPNNVRSTLLQLFRLGEIDKHAKAFAARNPNVDAIEVYLGLREKLGPQLELPVNTSHMLYEFSSGLTQQDYDRILTDILAKVGDGSFRSYLVKSEVMHAVLQRVLPEEFNLAKKELAVLVDNPDTGLFAGRISAKLEELKETGISLKPGTKETEDTMAQIHGAVADEYQKDLYGPLIDEFLNSAS